MPGNGFTNVPVYSQNDINKSFDSSSGGVPVVANSSANNTVLENVGNSFASVGTKVGEVGTRIGWETVNVGKTMWNGAIDKVGEVASIVPKGFNALTNNYFSKEVGQITSSISENVGDLVSFDMGSNGVTAGDIQQLKPSSGNGEGDVNFVRLVEKGSGRGITFDIMPVISESGDVSYDDVQITHHPGTIAKYATTPSRNWSISGIKLVCATADQATINQIYINLLRSWRMPSYGYGSEIEDPSSLGAPPPVLEFSAYGVHNVGNIPVVITSMSWDWPNDCDYIRTVDGEPFPVIINISISLKEAWTPINYSNFSLESYRKGELTNAYPDVIELQTKGSSQTSPLKKSSGITDIPGVIPQEKIATVQNKVPALFAKDGRQIDISELKPHDVVILD